MMDIANSFLSSPLMHQFDEEGGEAYEYVEGRQFEEGGDGGVFDERPREFDDFDFPSR